MKLTGIGCTIACGIRGTSTIVLVVPFGFWLLPNRRVEIVEKCDSWEMSSLIGLRYAIDIHLPIDLLCLFWCFSPENLRSEVNHFKPLFLVQNHVEVRRKR